MNSVPAYRIYWFNQDNHITEVDYLIAETDDDVRAELASYLRMASAVEVWHWARRELLQIQDRTPVGEQMLNRGPASARPPTWDAV